MDLVYRVAPVTRAYGQSTQLDRRVTEVQAIEKELADYAIERRLAYEARSEQYDRALPSISMYMRQESLQAFTRQAPRSAS